MNVLDIAIKSALSADSAPGGVAALATGGIFQLDAPQGTSPPYLIFQEANDQPGYTFGNTLVYDHAFYMIRGFTADGNTSGQAQASVIADRLKTLLTNPSLSVSGKTVLSSRFDRSYPPLKEFDSANNRWIYSRGVLCEIWLS